MTHNHKKPAKPRLSIGDDRIVEIGDSKQADFMPQIKMEFHGNEFNYSCRLLDDSPGKAFTFASDEAMIWQKTPSLKIVIAVVDHYCSLRNTTFPHISMCIHLYERLFEPVVFSIMHKGLTFDYQGDVHSDEDMTRERLPALVGGYVAYFMDKANGDYKTGKAFELYRPDVIDAAGNRAQCDMVMTADRLIVQPPADFMSNAVLPVVLT